METINRLAAATDVFVEIESNDELGAPTDPSSLTIEMAFSATRRLPDTPTWGVALWQADVDETPARYYAKSVIHAGDLVEGVWWPFVRVHNTPEQPIVAGRPFRIE